MRSSRPLDRRNSDPFPFHIVWTNDGRITDVQYIWTPDPKYQYGKLAPNPYLVQAREDWERTYPGRRVNGWWAAEQLALLERYNYGPHTRQGKIMEHAKRVFHLLKVADDGR